MTRAASAPELVLFRTPGQFSKLRAAIFVPSTVYTARVNQTFPTTDGLLSIEYDGGSGTLADVLPDMTLLVGSAAGLHDIGITRIRSADSNTLFIGETSDIPFIDNQYLTVINDHGLWARHVKIVDGLATMDGGIEYDDQHTDFDPTPIMGGNRVLKLEDADVSFDASDSYVFDSTITGYAWSAPTASSSSGMTTATPDIAWNTEGWHVVYLTLTAANGKQFFGVRYVYVWSDAVPPASAGIGECRQDAESGGWTFEITMYDNVDLDSVRDHALVILFAEDYYGDTKQSIGPVAGCENILAQGWIASESINWEPENGIVEFTGYTANFWMGKIPSFPDGVELVPGEATAWTNMHGLTVDRGVWHFLHWRTTATRIMDVFLSGDERYTKEVNSLASNLWEQVREMAFLQIFARAGCNNLNQFFLGIHPQLTAEADRSFPTVMIITKQDWEGQISFERVTLPQSAVVDLSGVAVLETGEGVPYFSLSPGHSYPHYGSLDLVDNLLSESQAQSNELAGLYRAWQNNPYPDLPVILSANNRLIDCFPNQQCAITIDAADTPRGIAYSGNIFPTSVAWVHDVETGYLHTEVTFEAETFADLAIDGDVPGGSVEVPAPTEPHFPPMPPFPVLFPGDVSPTTAPQTVIMVDDTYGLVHANNFEADGSAVSWVFSNAGIDSADVPYITRLDNREVFVFRTPNQSIWVGVFEKNFGRWLDTVYYSPAIGLPFTKVIDAAWLVANEPGGDEGISAMGFNPNKPEEIAFIIGNQTAAQTAKHFWIGNHSGFTQKAVLSILGQFAGRLTFGGGEWGFITSNNGGATKTFYRFNADGSSQLSAVTITTDGSGATPGHWRAGTSKTLIAYTGAGGTSELVARSEDGGASFTETDVNKTFHNKFAIHPDGLYMMAGWDAAAGERGKSSDGGDTWSGLASLPFGGEYCFAWAGGNLTASRWIAARGVIRYSPDFGTTWENKEGNIASLIPIGMSIMKIIVAGFNS